MVERQEMKAELRGLAALVIIMVTLMANTFGTDLSLIKNGSFEADGPVNPLDQHPYCWPDFFSARSFKAYIDSAWAQDGYYNLTIDSRTDSYFTNAHIVWFGQNVYLNDAKALYFDLKLGTSLSYIAWDNQLFVAFVTLDDVVVWDSLSFAVPTGEHKGVFVDLSGHEGFKKLRIGVRSTATGYHDVPYRSRWDNIHFDAYCRGLGINRGDFNKDCYVDQADLATLGTWWLENVSSGFGMVCDIAQNDFIDGCDYAMFADEWCFTTDRDNLNAVEVPLLKWDLNCDGQVNLQDYSMWANQWNSQAQSSELSQINEEWLSYDWRSWMGLQ